MPSFSSNFRTGACTTVSKSLPSVLLLLCLLLSLYSCRWMTFL
ncbi:unnamed protein product [Brassica oleracea]